MVVAQILLRIVHILLIVYLVLLWARIILELVQVIAREWRPRGFMLLVAEIVYSATDPPVRLLRRLIPPLRLGPVAIDLSVMLLMLVIIVLMAVVGAFLVTG